MQPPASARLPARENPHEQGSVPRPLTPLVRWWIYQRERFPIFGHGLLIASFSVSTVCFSMLLRGVIAWPEPRTLIVAFGTAFLFFLQLRIADEFKDFDEDSRYRPYRPVPRGLISLRELALLGVLAAFLQLGLALWLAPSLILMLALVWLYLLLMSREFFVGDWVRSRPIVYMLSHMAIVPLIDFYATACDWWPTAGHPPEGLFWFVAVSYFNGIVIDLGRKVRPPIDEELGVSTYSALWGPRCAVLVWLVALLATATCAVLAARAIDFVQPVVVWLLLLLALTGLGAVRFLTQPITGAGKKIEILSGLWTIGLYLSLGLVPLLLRRVTES
jgi:4-hydroxybenzoate polyprenyltransferase